MPRPWGALVFSCCRDTRIGRVGEEMTRSGRGRQEQEWQAVLPDWLRGTTDADPSYRHKHPACQQGHQERLRCNPAQNLFISCYRWLVALHDRPAPTQDAGGVKEVLYIGIYMLESASPPLTYLLANVHRSPRGESASPAVLWTCAHCQPNHHASHQRNLDTARPALARREHRSAVRGLRVGRRRGRRIGDAVGSGDLPGDTAPAGVGPRPVAVRRFPSAVLVPFLQGARRGVDSPPAQAIRPAGALRAARRRLHDRRSPLRHLRGPERRCRESQGVGFPYPGPEWCVVRRKTSTRRRC